MVRLLAVTALFHLHAAVPAHAGDTARQAGPRGALATFEGRTIDLAGDWGGARACLVWRQGGIVECFRNAEALDAREAQLAPRRAAPGRPGSEPTGAVTAHYSASCSSSLRLYEHNWYSGRRLSFWDRGFWQNLSDYGFEDRTSSYIVGGCWAYLAEHASGGGWWYPGTTSPYSGDPVMYSDWQDTISSVYVG